MLPACSDSRGGNGDPSPFQVEVQTAPIISNLMYMPSAAYLNTGAGQMTIVGSFGSTGAYGGVASVTIEVLDSAGNMVSAATTPVTHGEGLTRATLHGSVLVGTTVPGIYTIRVRLTDFAGRTSNALTGTFRIFDFPWASKTALPQARDLFAVATDGALAYVAGGEVLKEGAAAGPATARVDIYDPAHDTWRRAKSMPTARVGPAAAVANGVLYVIGGAARMGAPDLGTVEALDLATGEWSTRPPMPTARSSAAVEVIEGNVCVIGGLKAGEDVQTTECFDPATGEWNTLGHPQAARHRMRTRMIGGFGYTVGEGARNISRRAGPG